MTNSSLGPVFIPAFFRRLTSIAHRPEPGSSLPNSTLTDSRSMPKASVTEKMTPMSPMSIMPSGMAGPPYNLEPVNLEPGQNVA